LSQSASIKTILKSSLPAAVDLASQPVMWLVEAVYIGRLGAAALGGVGFALQIILVTMTLMLTLVMGAIIRISRILGSGNHREAHHIFGQTVLTGFLISIPIGLVWYFASPAIFNIIHERELVKMFSGEGISGIESGIVYLQTIALFSPVLITNFVAVGLIRGSGDTRISMNINITMNAANLLLAPVLIYGLFGMPRLEVQGAAIAVIFSHCLGFIMTLLYSRHHKTTLFLSLRDVTVFRWSSVKQLFQLGLPTTLEQLVWSIGQLIVTVYVALLGIHLLAIHQVFLRIQGVLSMFYLGFGIAAMTHMGKNLGADDHLLAEHTSKTTHRIVLVFGCFILVLLVLCRRPIISLFFREGVDVISNFSFLSLFIVFTMVQVPKALNTVISGSLRGAGDIKWLMWINIITVSLLEVGVNWVGAFVFHFGITGIWFVQFCDETIKSIINNSRFRGGKWKLIKV